MMPWVRHVARAALRSPTVSHAVRALASARGHRLVLVYHRLSIAAPDGCEIVPSVPLNVFRAQLQALGEVIEFVTLDEIVTPRERRHSGNRLRPAVAVTFDDDLPSHAAHALPVLRALRVPAAFFLSGRALHGLGAYWFQHLEALLTAYGERRTAALLQMPGSTARSLMLVCERSAELRRRVDELAGDVPFPSILQRDAIATLGAAGMTIGFHTLAHERLPDLHEAALTKAVSHGRDDLATAAGAAVRYFAYPHGKADSRSAAAVRRAGFVAAFTGAPQPVRRGGDLHQLGRWEPGPLNVDDLLVKLAVRLNRAAPLRRIEPS